MTEQDRADFISGLNTPAEQLYDAPVDTLLKGYKQRRNNPDRVKVIPTSREFREHYDDIRWDR